MKSKKRKSGTVLIMSWKEYDVGAHVYASKTWNPRAPPKEIVAFDLDFTLVKPKKGKKFPTDENDYEWLFPQVPEKLQDLAQDPDVAIIIFTNQGWKDIQKLEKMKQRVVNVVEHHNLPCMAFLASKHDKYRKPQQGLVQLMNRLMKKIMNDEYTTTSGKCMYIGDAAGRKGDHEDTDRTFAINAGWSFKTPEEYFLNKDPEPFSLKLDFSAYDGTGEDDTVVDVSLSPHAVLCVGRQGSGKSHHVEKTLVPRGFTRINQDTLRTKEKCIAEFKKVIKQRGKVVVDNTNPSRQIREAYIKVAKETGVPVTILYFDAPLAVCKHNNAFRAATDKSRDRVPDIAYRIFEKNFEEPHESEGAKVTTVSFTRDKSVENWEKYYV